MAARTRDGAINLKTYGRGPTKPGRKRGRYARVNSHYMVPGGTLDLKKVQEVINAPRSPRLYVFNHVTTRTAGNLVSSDNLWSDNTRQEYKGPPRGLSSPRDKPYRCNGEPDLVLSSLNHVRARNRVAAQSDAAKASDTSVGTSTMTHRQRDTSTTEPTDKPTDDVGTIAPRAVRPFFPSSMGNNGKGPIQTVQSNITPREVYHVQPLHARVRRCHLDRANGFKALKQELQASSARVKAMRSGNASIFQIGAADPTAMHTVKVGDNNAFAIASADRARGALARAAAQHRPKPPSSGGPRRPGSRPGSRPSQVPALDMGKLQRSGTAQSNDGRAGKAAANGGKASQAAVEPYREFVEEVMNKFLRLIAKYTRDDAGSGDEDGGEDGGDTGGAGGTEEGGDSDDAATHAATADGEGDHGDASGGGGGTEPSPEVQHLYKCYGIMMDEMAPTDFASLAFKHVRHGGLVGATFPGSRSAAATNAPAATTPRRPVTTWSDAADIDPAEQRPDGERVARTPSPTSYLPLSDRRVATPPTQWPSLTARTKQAMKAKKRIEARNNNEATRRDRLFRDFIAMEAPVVPPALVRTTQWGFGNSVAPSAGGAPSIWGNTSAQGSRSGLHRARSGIGTRGGVPPRTGTMQPPASAMGTSWFGVGRSGATGLGRTAPEFSSLRLTRQPQTAVVDYKERLGIDDAVGLGDKFEVDKAVLAEALQKLLHNLRDGHEDAMRYKFRAFTEVLNEKLSIPTSQQLKGVRILAELFRVRELRARIAGTEWYDQLLTLVSQTSATEGVNASERYCLKLVLEVLQAGLPFGRDALESIAVRLSTAEHELPSVQRILAYLRRLLCIPLPSWDAFLRENQLPPSLETTGQELFAEDARHFQWLRGTSKKTAAAAAANKKKKRKNGRRKPLHKPPVAVPTARSVHVVQAPPKTDHVRSPIRA